MGKISKSSGIIIRKDLQKYFEFVDQDKSALKCLVENCISLKTGDPTVLKFNKLSGWWNLERHLLSSHGIKVSSSAQGTKSTQVKITNHLIKGFNACPQFKGGYSRNDAKQISFERDVLDYIAIDGAPLDCTRRPGFVQLMRNRDPNLRMPSRRTNARKMHLSCQKVHSSHKEMLKKIPARCLHISLDIWTSRGHQAVLGIRAHFVDSEARLRNLILGFKHFPHMKTGHNVRHFVKEYLLSLGVKPQQLGVVMADNASENVKAFQLGDFIEDNRSSYDGESSDEEVEEIEFDNSSEAENTEATEAGSPSEQTSEDDGDDLEAAYTAVIGWTKCELQRLGCICHALNLITKDCAVKSDAAKAVIEKVSKLVNFFHHSAYWAAQLKKKAGKNLVKAGTTRWNSNSFALNRLLEENYIQNMNSVLVQAKQKKQDMKLGGTQPPDPISPIVEEDIKQMGSLLSPFILATNKLQSSGVTSSLVIGTIVCLYKAVARVEVKTEEMKQLKTLLCLSLSERFGADNQYNYSGRGAKKQLLQIFGKKEYILAAILDPRVKMSPFMIPLNEPFNMDKYACSVSKAKSILEEEALNNAEELEENILDQHSQQIPEFEEMPCNSKSMFDDMFATSHNETAVYQGNRMLPSLTAKQEIQNYLDESKLQEQSDPLAYWKNNQGKFPMLSRLAYRFLGFPASSSDIERTFSVSGSLARSRRARLEITTIEDIICHRESRLRNN